jgi:hypothetical protein
MLIAAASSWAQPTVEIDNAWVRVLRVKQAPHETAPAHQHPDSVAVYLTDFATHKAGDVAWRVGGIEAGSAQSQGLACGTRPRQA